MSKVFYPAIFLLMVTLGILRADTQQGPTGPSGGVGGAGSTAVAAAVYASGSYLAKTGWSDSIPFGNTEFETDATIHDSTIADSGTATGAQTTTTLKDTTKTWTINAFTGYSVRITGGTGVGQWRNITSNTVDTLTVGAWTTTPDGTSTYEVTSVSSRLTVPVAGVYRITVNISYQNGVAGAPYGLAILQNGGFKSVNFVHDNSTTELTFGYSRLLSLAANDYIEMRTYNGDAAALNLNSGSLRVFFQLEKI